MTATSTAMPLGKIFYRQSYHVAAAILGLVLFLYLDRADVFGLDDGDGQTFLLLDKRGWYYGVSSIAPIHQIVYIAPCWRYELHGEHLTRLIGSKDRAFWLYFFGFFVLFLFRFFSLGVLAALDAGSLTSVPHELLWAIGVPATFLFLWTQYSVKTYFTLRRAVGEDHFRPDEHRNMGLVKGGIFAYLDNAMYWTGLLGLHLPGLFLASKASLACAAWQHVFIWAHYFCTEKPDMETIYGSEKVD